MLGGKKMKNIGIAKMKEELIRLNPTVKFDVLDTTVSPINIIYANVSGESLKLPNGYYYNGDSISNKGNTENTLYENFLYRFDTAHFENKPTEVSPSEPTKAKKSLFARIFAR